MDFTSSKSESFEKIRLNPFNGFSLESSVSLVCGNFPSYLHNADQKRNNKSKRHKRKHNEQAF